MNQKFIGYKKQVKYIISAVCMLLLASMLMMQVQAVDVAAIDVPEFTNVAYVEINENEPFFEKEDMKTTAFEKYSSLDQLGRCGVAYANICKELMPTKKRGKIGSIKPTGWQLAKYEFVDGKYLYNRCHLIGFQLAGENANDKNLITGTRYLNIDGMLPFENLVADYVKQTNNHVLYRVTPIYEGDNLVASGVLMEAKSVEDNGKGVSYCVFAFNNQPGVTIDYANGANGYSENYQDEIQAAAQNGAVSVNVTNKQKPANADAGTSQVTSDEVEYILNTNTHKFHTKTCRSVKTMKAENKQIVKENRGEIIAKGYQPCKNCNP